MGFLMNSNILCILAIIFMQICIIAPVLVNISSHNAILSFYSTVHSKDFPAGQQTLLSGKTLKSTGSLRFQNPQPSLTSKKSSLKASNAGQKLEHVPKASPSDDHGHGEQKNLEDILLELEGDPEKLAKLMENVVNTFKLTAVNKKGNPLTLHGILTYAAKWIHETGEKDRDLLVAGGKLVLADEEIQRIEQFSKLVDQHELLKEKEPQKLRQLGPANFDHVLPSVLNEGNINKDELNKQVFGVLNLKGSAVRPSEAQIKVLHERIKNHEVNNLVGQLGIPDQMKNAFFNGQNQSIAIVNAALLIGDRCKFW